MDFISAKYFYEVAKSLNFTKTAEKLNTSQQVLSGHIKRLEEEYEIVLFERKPKIRLTYAGEIFFETVKQIIEAEENFKAQISHLQESQYGTISLGLSTVRANVLLPLIAPVFKEICPNVTLSLTEANSSVLEKSLLEGDIDVAILSRSSDIHLNNPLFHTVQLIDEKLYLLGTEEIFKQYIPHYDKSFKAKMASGMYMKDLMELPVIMDWEKSRIQECVHALYVKEKKRPNISILATHGSSLISLCRQGYTTVFCLQMILFALLNQMPFLKKELNIVPLLDSSLRNEVVLAYRSDRILPKYLSQFIELTQKLFAEQVSQPI